MKNKKDKSKTTTTQADADGLSYLVVNGIQGEQGFQGVQGEQGDQGFQGAKGDQGDQGFQGAIGEQGDQGFQGAKGDQGANGDQGAKGEQGDQGFQGAKGDQGANGDQGAKGEQGDQGFQGAKGDQGANGDQGAKGDQGDQGFQGAKGDQGANGDQGAKGDQGNQGFQGAKGDQGNQGAIGNQGANGNQGNQGNQGAKGNQGANGNQGATGAQGATGSVTSGLIVLTSGSVPSGYTNTGSYIYAQDDSSTFVTNSAMPLPKMWAASAVIGNLIYIIGGSSSPDTVDSTSNAMQIYDTATDTWVVKYNSLPYPLIKCSAVVYQDQIYLFGGKSTNGEVMQSNLLYDPATDTWTEKSTGNFIPEYGASAALLGAQIYATGGEGPNFSGGLIYTYFPASNSWGTIYGVNTQVTLASSVGLSDLLYMMTGQNLSEGGTFNGYMDPASKKIFTISDMPVDIQGAGASPLAGLIYVAGGVFNSNKAPSSVLWAYSPTTNSWAQQSPTLNTPRYACSMVTVGTKLFVIGGSTSYNGTASNTVESYDVAGVQYFLLQKN